eukprot:5270970-Karenia_brevis.AAC.1
MGKGGDGKGWDSGPYNYDGYPNPFWKSQSKGYGGSWGKGKGYGKGYGGSWRPQMYNNNVPYQPKPA